MPEHSYTSRRELDQYVFHGAVTVLVPVAAVLLQSVLPRLWGRLEILDLPLIVVIADIGVAAGKMTHENAAALIAAGILSVLLFPITGLRLLQRGGARTGPGGAAPASPPSPTFLGPDEVPPSPARG